MTKEEFLYQIRLTHRRGKYTRIFAYFDYESRTSTTAELITFLCSKFLLTEEEKKDLNYSGIFPAQRSYKKKRENQPLATHQIDVKKEPEKLKEERKKIDFEAIEKMDFSEKQEVETTRKKITFTKD